MLQTFVPEHYAIRAASQHDVNGFLELELAQRLRLGFPPYTRLIRLEYRHHDGLRAEEEAQVMAGMLRERFQDFRSRILR